jgi:hypothetical protein
LLRNPAKCELCELPIINLCVFSQENDNETKVDVYSICGCNEFKHINREFFTVYVYLNLIEIYDRYSDDIEYYREIGDSVPKELEQNFNYAINNYISEVRNQRMGMPIIHAVGLVGERMSYGDEDERFIGVIWKERYISQYIKDEYPL